LRRIKYQNTIFHFFIQTLRKLACKGVNHKCVLFNKDCIFERYFQTLLSPVFKGIISNPISISFMQAKSFCQVYKVLLENLILFEKPVSYCPTLIP
jgi:hypothetical protein